MDAQTTTLLAYSMLCLAPADAILNDTELRKKFKNRAKKGIIWGLVLSLIPCLLLYLAQQSNVEKGEAAFSILQWAISFPLSSVIFTLIFTVLFILRPHPSRNRFGFLRVFTIIFWAASIALIFFCSIFIVHKTALLLA